MFSLSFGGKSIGLVPNLQVVLVRDETGPANSENSLDFKLTDCEQEAEHITIAPRTNTKMLNQWCSLLFRSPKLTVFPKSPMSALKCNSSQAKSQGRVTRKDMRMHKLVFEEDGLPDGTELGYSVCRQKRLVGYKRGFGILCTCNNSEISPSQFEAHAGFSSRRKP
ncbi:hypothetical protein F3Y22_tig00116965pilonHSYRG00418 [Hibiscus syriacus]|uniref:Tify domain-containing protein n=1 Tax=Hibiscus syriacus TaxID=106335 RepID=A0A6A2WTY6_HIBSY|nr:hypothetical protein F3Y22_tig00116965pilonHSYRG00418 [Hibiscus syriacus]